MDNCETWELIFKQKKKKKLQVDKQCSKCKNGCEMHTAKLWLNN